MQRSARGHRGPAPLESASPSINVGDVGRPLCGAGIVHVVWPRQRKCLDCVTVIEAALRSMGRAPLRGLILAVPEIVPAAPEKQAFRANSSQRARSGKCLRRLYPVPLPASRDEAVLDLEHAAHLARGLPQLTVRCAAAKPNSRSKSGSDSRTDSSSSTTDTSERSPGIVGGCTTLPANVYETLVLPPAHPVNALAVMNASLQVLRP